MDKEKIIVELIKTYYDKITGYKLYNDIKNELIIQIKKYKWTSILKLKEYIFIKICHSINVFDYFDIYLFSVHIREIYSSKIFGSDHEHRMSELNDIALILQILYVDKNIEWGNESISEKIFEVLELIKIFNIVDINSAFISDNVGIDQLIDSLEPNNEEEINDFLDNEYLVQAQNHSESYQISDKKTNDYLDSIGENIFHIKKSFFNSIGNNLGFYWKDFSSFYDKVLEIKNKLEFDSESTLLCIKEEQLFEKFFAENITKSGFTSIINILCIQNYDSVTPCPRKMELLCINRMGNELIFSLNCLAETLMIINNIIISGHFSDYFSFEIPKKITNESLRKMCNYFSYAIADVLNSKGFYIPRKSNGSYYVDIMDVGEGKERIVFNDIDVLAIDNVNKKILNIEAKYYKPALDYRKMVMSSLKKKYNSLLRREKKIKENLKLICDNIFKKDVSNYEVVTIIVTSRPMMIKNKYEPYNTSCYSFAELQALDSIT